MIEAKSPLEQLADLRDIVKRAVGVMAIIDECFKATHRQYFELEDWITALQERITALESAKESK